MSAAPDLRLVTRDGEIAKGIPSYQDLVDEIENLKQTVATKGGAITKLQRELAEVRGIEPDGKEITEVLEFYRDFSGRKIAIDSGSQRWAKTRARLRQKCDPPITVERLKRAIVGAPNADWFKDTPERQDPTIIFNTAENVEKCERAAGKSRKPVQVSDLSPLEAVAHMLSREFGRDAIDWLGGELWATCPLHPTATVQRTLRICERQSRGSLTFACVHGCEPDDIYDALRVLYALQGQRHAGSELADLRVQVSDLERSLRMYSRLEWWENGVLMKDRGHSARVALGIDNPTMEESAA